MAQPDLQPIADPEGLFRRLGRILQIVKTNRLWQIVTAQTETDNVLELYEAQFDTAGDPIDVHDIDQIPDFERGMYNRRAGRNSMNTFVASTAKRAILEGLNAVDVLYQTDDETVLAYLIRLMNDNTTEPAGAATIDRPDVAVGAENPHGDNTGDGHVIIDTVNKDGIPNPYIRAEEIDFVIISKTDSDKGTLQKRGFPNRTDRNNYKWPGGSGSGTAIKVCDQKTDAGSAAVASGANLLTNSDFEDFTANLPDQWEADEGVAGTDFGAESSLQLEGTAALRLIGTAASIAPRIRQKFNDSADGTIANLKTGKKYAIHFWYRSLNAAAQGSGNFEVRVKIGSEETSFTKSLGDTWPTDYTVGTVFINTPATITATGVNLAIFVGLESGADLTLNEEIYIDFMCMVECVEQGNLFMAAVNGTTDFALEDRITIPITNSGVMGGGSDGEFSFYLDWIFDLWSRGLIIPDSATPNIPDNLIA